MTSSCG